MATYSGSISPRLFPLARIYAAGRKSGGQVREADQRSFPWSERHLQCVWYDHRLRPATLTTAEGESVTVRSPGTWNLEAGPDFLRAVVEIGPGRRRMEGDVELHVHAGDWNIHHHADDPRYRNVRFHVTYFPDRRPGGLPEGAAQIPLQRALKANPFFAFDTIDLAAYPYQTTTKPTACARILQSWSPEQKSALLNAAGQERLRRKAERLAAAIREKGEEQVLYEEILCALGYKHNKDPFRVLAEQVTLEALREEADGDNVIAYAILAGVANLLPRRAQAQWDRETKQFVRALWDIWWKKRERWEHCIMPHDCWRLSGIRPANHPVRRLMAAAEFFTRASMPGDRLRYVAANHPDIFVKEALHMLDTVTVTFWEQRLSFASGEQHRPVALIGKRRAGAIVTNVLVPFLAAIGEQAPFEDGFLARLPVETNNAVVRETAHHLFGPDHNPKLYQSGLGTQGLLQIFHDFCVSDRTRCEACPLPGLLDGYRKSL